jgi:nucleoside-diphosphate-sugar epimerase
MGKSPMRAFVTGGSGFIGGHLVDSLVARGFEVRALIHRSPLRPQINVEIWPGDICDKEMLSRALQGTDILFHLASALGSSAIGPDEFRRINAQGAESVLEAALSAGVGRVVHFSSAGVFGSVRKGDAATESSPPNPLSVYDKTKFEGEEAALRFVSKGLDVVVIRPGWVYGPGDRRTFKLIKAVCSGRFIMATRGKGFQTPVYIDDLVKGTLLAGEKGQKGQVYNLAGGEILTVRAMVEEIAAACGRKLPRLYLPLFPARPAALFLEKAFAPLRREPPLSRSKLSFFIHSKPLSIDKARLAFGYSPEFDFRNGIARTISWYRNQGWLPPPPGQA